MVFTCTIADGTDQWEEHYNQPGTKTLEDASHWANEVINGFNSSLRPGEKPRTLVSVTLANAVESQSTHTWNKSSLVTQGKPNGPTYDTMKCSVCGITGKRYGISSTVVRGNSFKAQGFENCAKSIELLERRRNKQ